MPINAYTGLMGSGKSYETVANVIIPAIAKGRRVVSNVENLNVEGIREFAANKFNVEIAQCGSIVQCTNEDVKSEFFFPFGADDIQTFVQPGDLVVLDEAWRFFGTDCKLQEKHKIFFREHRHYVHPETKVSCDIVLIIQDISDLHRSIRVVVEFTFRFTKLKSLGFNSNYRVDIWEGYKTPLNKRTASHQKRYDKEIFPLYSSYVGGAGKEQKIDSRINILAQKKIWFIVVFMGFVFYFGVSYLRDYFDGKAFGVEKNDAKKGDSVDSPQKSLQNANVPAGQLSQAQPVIRGSSRIVGRLQIDDRAFYLVYVDGVLTPLSPGAVYGQGLETTGSLDGQRYHLSFDSGSQ